MTSSCTSMASEVFQWNGADVSNEGKQEKIKEELADVVNYCVLMADACGLDLDEIVWEKIKVNAKKYPVEKAKMNMDARNRSVQKFHDDDIRILFATPASAKEGLTLTMANHVIFYDRGFSLDDYLQAQDRIHRISQKKTCYVHNIIIKDSIDEWVDLLLKAKQNAAALSQGDISLGDYQGVADYSFGDIVKSILGFEEVDE